MGLSQALVVAQGLQGSLGCKIISSSARERSFKKRGDSTQEDMKQAEPFPDVLRGQALFESLLLQSSEAMPEESKEHWRTVEKEVSFPPSNHGFPTIKWDW
jgi:hypothetical protein